MQQLRGRIQIVYACFFHFSMPPVHFRIPNIVVISYDSRLGDVFCPGNFLHLFKILGNFSHLSEPAVFSSGII